MDLTLDSIQELIQENARRFLATELNSEKIRDIEASPDGFSRPLWDEITGLGWTGASLPERYGGGGRGILDLCVLAEEMGRAVASTPLVVSAGLASAMLRSVPASPLTEELLIKLASKGEVISVALVEADGRNERSVPSLQLAIAGEDLKVTGEKVLVPYASVAKEIITSARNADGEVVLVVVSGESGGLEMSRHKTIGGEPLFHVRFQDVAIPKDRILAQGESAVAALNAGLDVAAVLAVAEAVGLSEGIINLTTGHARLRQQFGKPIGSFQAVSHPCADMRIQADACRLLALEAAWLIDQGRPAALEVASTKAFANE
ncbi:MAG: acyl-CoA dehydrogenase family protein, partial [Alphaproteobacteria bacterium]|nr:acyl-CoA dehydrogenase family protein [Alphaproteobacteria bacterium]